MVEALSRKNIVVVTKINDNDEKELLKLRKISACIKVRSMSSLLAQITVKSTFHKKKTTKILVDRQ